MQLQNILPISVTLVVSNLLSSNIILVKLIQDSNKLFIFLTFDVLKFDKSKYSNDSQFLNIHSIFVTDSVLKFDTFKEINDLQLLNIYSIFVACGVSGLFENIIELNFIQSLNI